MKTYRWKMVKSVLAHMETPSPPQDADTFWQEFRKQALKSSILGRSEPVKHSIIPLPFKLIVLSGAVAAALVFAVTVRIFIVSPAHGMTKIKSLKIHAAHQAVFLVNDTTRRTTILWISGIED